MGDGIVIVFAKEVSICQYFRVNSYWSEHIKSEFSLWEKVILLVLWEVRISEQHADNNVVLIGLDSFFSGICLVAVWGHFLVHCLECVCDEFIDMP